eukprot:1836725-Amphidinium_carterae.3
MVSIKRYTSSTPTTTASSIISLNNAHDTTSANKTGEHATLRDWIIPKKIYNINATLTIHKNNTSKDQLRQWAILIHTIAMTSVASQDHFTHIPLKPLRPQDPHALTAVNGEQINIYGIKEVTLVYQNIAIPTAFIISDVNCAILGLDTVTTEVQLHYIGNHVYLKATVFNGLYDYVDYTPDFASWYYTWYDECVQSKSRSQHHPRGGLTQNRA